MEPGRRSPKRRNSSSNLDRSDSNFERVAEVMGSSLCVYIRSEVCHKKRRTAIYHLCVAHPFLGLPFTPSAYLIRNWYGPSMAVPCSRDGYSARGDADNVETQGGGSGEFD